MPQRFSRILALGVALVLALSVSGQPVTEKILLGHVPPVVAQLKSNGLLPATNRLHLTFSLPLRNQPELDDLIRQLYDSSSPNYRKFITPQEFTARFGPAESDYATLLEFARTNGFEITGTQPNRVLMDVVGTVATAERVFGVTLRTYRHPKENRDFYAPDTQPSVAAPVALLDVIGLDNYSLPRPKSALKPLTTTSQATPRSGSGSGGSYLGNDFRAAYVPGTPLTGSGQSVALLQFDGYYPSDIASYLTTAGYPLSLTNALINVPVNGGVSKPGSGNSEVCLDIEMVMSMAPGVSNIYVYEGPNGSTSWPTILSKIANDNLARQVSCSWGSTSAGAPDPTSEGIFKQMAAQGQSFFNASGDSDAFVGGIPFPSESTNITQVGGTTLSTTGPGGAWSSETAWNWGGGTGTSGGVSANYGIPVWQQGISMAANLGSTSMRNVPDVALTGDNVYVAYNNGSSGVFGGTSCAAPLWAAFTALINQQAAAVTSPPMGFINPAIYAIGKGGNYNTCFHDTTTGDNYWTKSPTNFPAVTGFDLCTGWGTPKGTNLINTLVPLVFAPSIAAGTWTLLAESASPTNGAIDPGETVAVSFALQNQGSLATSNLVATLQPNAGVLAPGAPQTYGVLAAFGGSTNRPFTFTAAGTCGSSIVAGLQLQDGTNNLGTVSFTLPLGKGLGLSQNFDGVTAPNLPSGWTMANVVGTAAIWTTTTASFDTSPNSAFIADPVNPGENALVSPLVFISSTNAQLAFRHNYSLEYGTSHGKTYYYDGGVLEIQIGNGAFTDILSAGGSFVAGGYNRTITTSSDNPLGGRSAWVGSSSGWASVTVNLPSSAAGQNIQLRWNCATDTGNVGSSAVGWYVDSVLITDGVPTCLSVLTDIAASQSLATTSLQVGQNLIYTLAVTNLGPQPAANVILTDTVPANVTFVSASPGCIYSAGQVICPVGMLAPASLTNFTVTFAPAGGSVFTNFVSVGTVTPEISTANNTATLVTTQSASAPPSITGSVTNRTLQCGSNSVTFSVTASGTPPFAYQWSLDAVPVFGATNTSYSLTNLHLPNHTVAVTVTNLYGSVTSNALLTVLDTLMPSIALNGGNPIYVELGNAFADPGATATDTCMGVVPVTVSGSVNTNAVGTNTLTYTATDGNGNTNTVPRSVIVRDTTPPTILWSFTNLVLAADTNCSARMPDVTGTNFIMATDLSGALTILQSPTNTAILSLGTNVVIITVKDSSGNAAYSTNRIVVQDQTPPVISSQPQSQTNFAGATATFTAGATACTPVAFQWYFANAALAAKTNSTLTLSNLTLAAAGNYFVIATASGGSSTSVVATLTVNLLSSTVALASSVNPSGFKDSVNFTASVTPTNATGTVQFFTNGTAFDLQTLVAGGAVSTNLTLLPRGTNLVTAVYSGDSNDLPSTNLLAQIVTNHPPVAAPAFYTNTPSLTLNIPIAGLATNWSDVDGDVVSLASVSVSTNGITLTNNDTALVYFNSNNVADQFTCTIADGWGGTNLQTVSIAPAPLTNTTPLITGIVAGGNGSVILNLGGAPGYTYILETTTNLPVLVAWLPIATNTLTTNVWPFTDLGATNFQQRFYRLKLAP